MHYIISLFIIFFQITLFATDPVIRISVNPPAIGTNEVAEIRIDVYNESLSEIPSPSTNSQKFNISYKGMSSQRQLININGNIQVKNIYAYIYQFTPNSTGKINIPTFIITTKKGKQIYSESSSITVENTDRLQAPNPKRGGNPFSMFVEGPTEAFLQLDVTRNKLYQNTGLIADLYLFSDDTDFLNQRKRAQQAYPPRFDGGLVHSITIPEQTEIITRTFGTSVLYGKLITKYIIFPLEKGKLNFYPPAFYIQSGIRNFNIVGDPIEIESIPITKNLTYIGDELTLSVNLSQNKMNATEEQILTFSIEGDGNVDFFVDPFKNLLLTNLFISSPTSTLELGIEDSNNSNNIYMKKVFTYTIIPKQEGSYTIPSVTLNYADNSGNFTSSKTEAFTLQVSANNSQQNTTTKKMTLLPEISQTFFYNSGIQYIIGSLIIGLLIMFVSVLQAIKINKLSTDINYARASGAQKRLQQIMAHSEKAIKDNQYKEAARLIRQSVLYFCADKFSISNSSSPQDILDYLEKNNIEFAFQTGFLQLLNILDFHAFATTPSDNQIKNYLSEAYTILNEINKIKIK
ncbi:MAG: BatD family protein [Spirochaetota bacterium]|nr:BatD family protein [Spirochaetota bacterium]